MTFVVVFLDSRRGIGAVHRYAGASPTNAERKHRYSVTVDQRWRSRSSQRFTQTLLLVNLFSDKQIATTVQARNEDTIVSAQQNVKPMRTPSMRRKGTVRRTRTIRESSGPAAVPENDELKDDNAPFASSSASGNGCIAGGFRAALDTLFETLARVLYQPQPTTRRLNQLEGRNAKGQVRSFGLPEITGRVLREMQGCAWACGVFVGGDEKSVVEQAKGAFGLPEGDLVLGAHKVFLSHSAFHILEDHTRFQGVEEQKHNCLRDAEAEADLDPRGGLSDPYAPYPITTLNAKYEDNLGPKSIQQLSLVANASPFQRADLYNDEYKENRSIASDGCDKGSRLTSNRDDSVSRFGSGSSAF
ncbi:hypothetical protein VKT23_008702 [Stygiomarasmius scandens]|uniref:Uncharacterized protein n=1 Tax=Marasmiellus scandens TaxID=2682957 RepID=A0ABR1JH56_9AGAR